MSARARTCFGATIFESVVLRLERGEIGRWKRQSPQPSSSLCGCFRSLRLLRLLGQPSSLSSVSTAACSSLACRGERGFHPSGMIGVLWPNETLSDDLIVVPGAESWACGRCASLPAPEGMKRKAQFSRYVATASISFTAAD